MNIKLCVRLENNENVTCTMPSEAYGGETMKKWSVFEEHKRFRDSSHVEITRKDNVHHFLRYQGYYSL
jgi:hypothetical protein